MTEENFRKEIREALGNYDRFVVCLGKTLDEFETSLVSLVRKAIHAFETRAPGLRHGIALDRFITVILSQSDSERPHCGIYFNLHSPYQKQVLAAAEAAAAASAVASERETPMPFSELDSEFEDDTEDDEDDFDLDDDDFEDSSDHEDDEDDDF